MNIKTTKMNIQYFHESLEMISHTGAGPYLNIEQQCLIENSLIILQSENKFSHIFFWGRISGVKNDYYIAFGYPIGGYCCLKARRFFFSTNCVQWYLLQNIPTTSAEQYEMCLLVENQFQGDITFMSEVKMDSKFKTNLNQQVISAEPYESEIRILKEEHRLACIVQMITAESAIMPRGSVYKQVNGKFMFNSNFNGLNQMEARKMENLHLYRLSEPENWNLNLLKYSNYNYSTDLFDSLDSVIPINSSFSLTIIHESNLLLVKSLHWLGMTFFHKCKTNQYGFMYFGDGRKNRDILFMLN